MHFPNTLPSEFQIYIIILDCYCRLFIVKMLENYNDLSRREFSHQLYIRTDLTIYRFTRSK